MPPTNADATSSPPDSLVGAIDAYREHGACPSETCPYLARVMRLIADAPNQAVRHGGLLWRAKLQAIPADAERSYPTAEQVDRDRAEKSAEAGPALSAGDVTTGAQAGGSAGAFRRVASGFRSLGWATRGAGVPEKDRADARRLAGLSRRMADQMDELAGRIEAFGSVAAMAKERRREADLLELLADLGDWLELARKGKARVASGPTRDASVRLEFKVDGGDSIDLGYADLVVESGGASPPVVVPTLHGGGTLTFSVQVGMTGRLNATFRTGETATWPVTLEAWPQRGPVFRVQQSADRIPRPDQPAPGVYEWNTGTHSVHFETEGGDTFPFGRGIVRSRRGGEDERFTVIPETGSIPEKCLPAAGSVGRLVCSSPSGATVSCWDVASLGPGEDGCPLFKRVAKARPPRLLATFPLEQEEQADPPAQAATPLRWAFHSGGHPSVFLGQASMQSRPIDAGEELTLLCDRGKYSAETFPGGAEGTLSGVDDEERQLASWWVRIQGVNGSGQPVFLRIARARRPGEAFGV